MTLDEVRKKYLDYFEAKGHKIVPSASLVPENDPTTLFTGSGMQPMLRYFLGTPHPLGTRIADSQKSFRAQDIEEVGDNRHTTCYPGNEEVGTRRDTESALLWQEVLKGVGIEAEIGEFPEKDGIRGSERIFYYGDKKNWWSRAGEPKNMPEGEPGGPDTEMFWDFGPSTSSGQARHTLEFGQVCHVNCDCGRFMEIGNNVFMEYVKQNGNFEKLPKPNVDFGAGLERLAAATLDNPDVFFVSAFENARKALEKYGKSSYEHSLREYRIVLDHIRGATFLIADGVSPGNTDRSYILRRLIRRAVLYADRLSIPEGVLGKILPEAFAQNYSSAYGELENELSSIQSVIEEEENRFRKTLRAGEPIFEKIYEVNIGGSTVTKALNSQAVFDLVTTYGYPLELVKEKASERGLYVDDVALEREMERHREISRAGLDQKFKGGLAGTSEMEVKYHTATHLLHQALRSVLGDHVLQRGSNITPERLRFDFSHPQKLTPEEIKKVEEWVNEKIEADYPVTKEELSPEEARQRGAIGLFGEKYGDIVSTYRIGDNSQTASLEFCGGPHVERTGVLGTFKIDKEEAVAAGVRRIKATLS